jgi:TolB protein
MMRSSFRQVSLASAMAIAMATAGAALAQDRPAIDNDLMPQEFARDILSSEYSDIRLTIAPDGRTALWFSRNRPGGPGGYDIWMSRRVGDAWQPPQAVSFNSPTRDFDPAFSPDGRFVYFASDRAGGVGGDDLYRVAVTKTGFAEVEHLGSEVNSARNEWAPMLAPDGRTLLFSSNGHGGAGRMDLFTARWRHARFTAVTPLPGAINTPADEFDATFLRDGKTVIYARANNIETDPVALYCAVRIGATYRDGMRLADEINTPGSNTYAPMLDWSQRDRVTFTTRRPADDPRGADLYTFTVRIRRDGEAR